MIKNVLSDLGGVGLYGVVSICLFFAVFITAIVITLRTRRSYLNHMGALPLEDGSVTPTTYNVSSHE